MKVAILLSGQPRFTGDFDVFLENLQGYDQADWFIYLTNDNIDRELYKPYGISILDNWVKFDVNYAKERIEKNLPSKNYIRSIEISDASSKAWPVVSNKYELRENWESIVFSMYYNIHKVNEARLNYQKQTDSQYDAIIRIRSDVGIKSKLDIQSLTINPQTVYISNNVRHGLHPFRCNDQMAISDSSSMNTYCDAINWLKYYNDRGIVFHPETLLGCHLAHHNIKLESGSYDISLREIPINIDRWG